MSETFTLSVRPEAISRRGEQRPRNHFEATVGDVLFLGHERELLVDVGDQRLMVEEQRRTYRRGTTIELGWASGRRVDRGSDGDMATAAARRLGPITELPRRLPERVRKLPAPGPGAHLDCHPRPDPEHLSLSYSLWQNELGSIVHDWNVDNYRNLFASEVFQALLGGH